MEPGKFNCQVTFKSPVDPEATQNDLGEPTGTPATLGTRYGFLEPITNQEAWQGEQVQDLVSHRLTCRYLAGVTTAHWFTWDGRTFEIVSVRDIEEAGWELEVLAREKR